MTIKTHGQDEHSVAIIGLSCRFPSDGDNLENFWQMICRGQSAWSEIPKDRFNVDAFHSPTGSVNTSIARGAHFLKQDVKRFDAKFFNFSKAEADAMDPQHRLMIEVTYEALEKAGLPLESLVESRTGVFMGHFTGDYREALFRDPECAPKNSLTGSSQTSLANRISWLFDLRGPSFSLDTACSSSLVSLHLACQSLQNGESDLAIVGGVNLLLNPEMFMYLSNQHFLSPDGRCKSFDESADGYGRGEGFAAVILKRIDDAVAQRDPVRAVIRGTGSNHNGHTKGFTLPSAEAQAALIQDTYRLAELDFSDTNYVEAHGTGTQAGDGQETEAISRTISRDRPPGQKLLIGSVKSNIGHLEACAGLAGIVKSVLILESGMIPPTIHYERGNPKIKFDEWKLEVPTTLTPWPTTGVRRISTSSYGYGGTNAHAILDDAYSYLRSRNLVANHHTNIPLGSKQHSTLELVSNGDDNTTDKHAEHQIADAFISNKATFRPQVFVYSAQSRDSLEQVHSSLVKYLASMISRLDDRMVANDFLHNLAYAFSQRRSALRWRSFAIATTPEDLLVSLKNQRGDSTVYRAMQSPRIGFVFTGQGAQWACMGVELMRMSIFRESVDAADTYLKKVHGCPWSATEELGKGKATSLLHLAEYSQALCTIIQVALIDLLKSWSVVPTAVVGHSSGEIGAAYCLGALGRADAWTLAYTRGRLANSIGANAPELQGAMIAANLSEEQAEVYISRLRKGEVVVACINSPSSVTISGDSTGIDELLRTLTADNVFARKLRVDAAYHSPHMQTIAQDYYEAVGDIETSSAHANRTMYSSVTGTKIDASELGAAYWVRNLTSPVQFSAAVHDMVRPITNSERSEQNAVDIVIEIGPHSALQGPVTQTLEAHGITDITYTSAIVRNQDGLESALKLAGILWSSGVNIDLSMTNNDIDALTDHSAQLLADLPTYPWDHSQIWGQESRLAKEYRLREWPSLSLLGAPTPSTVYGQYNWRKMIRLSEEPWIRDHKISGSVIYPGAGYIAMAIEAANQMTDPHQTVQSFKLRDVKFTTALILNEESGAECTIQLKPHVSTLKSLASTWTEFSVTTCTDGKTLQQNCRGFIMVEYQSSESSQKTSNTLHLKEQYQHAAESCRDHADSEQFYEDLYGLGLEYGQSFTNIVDIYTAPGTSFCTLNIPNIPAVIIPNLQHRPHVIHPGTLDATFHLAFAALKGAEQKLTKVMVPHTLEEISISASLPYEAGQRLKGFSSAAKQGINELRSDIVMFDEAAGDLAVTITGLMCTGIGGDVSVLPRDTPSKKLCSKMTWYPAINMLTQEEKHQLLYRSCAVAKMDDSETGYGGTKAISQTLLKYLRLKYTSAPNLSILEVVDGEMGQSPVLLLPYMEGLDTLSTAEYTIAYGNSETMSAAENMICKSSITPRQVVLDFSQHPDEWELTGERFDIVIISAHSEMTGLLNTTIKHARQFLTDEGELCCIATGKADSGVNTVVAEVLKSSLSHHGLDINLMIDCAETSTFHQHHKFLTASIHKDPTTVRPSSDEIVILQPPNASKYIQAFSAQLSDALESLHFQPQTSIWGPDESTPPTHHRCIISLLEMEKSYLYNMNEPDFSRLQHHILHAKHVLWVCGLDGPEAALITGLARVIRNEIPGLVFRTLHTGTSTEASLSLEELAEMTSRVYDCATGEDEFSIRDGVLCVSRVEEDDVVEGQLRSFVPDTGRNITMLPLSKAPGPLKLSVQDVGGLESPWFEVDRLPETELGHDEVEIDVKATTLNLPESTSTTSLPPSTRLTFNVTGTVRRIGSSVVKFTIGDAIAMFARDTHRTVHRSKADVCELIPKHLSFEDAASIPTTHGTAWYGLVQLAQVHKGQSTLIHAAAGGVGQSAIQIARHHEMEIFVTYRSDDERNLLRDTYGIPDDHVLDLNDLSFMYDVKRMTQGRGVDVVLNSATITREALRQTWHCVAPFGYFLDSRIGDNPHHDTELELDIRSLPQNVTFSSYNLTHIARSRPDLIATIMSNIFDLRRRGITRPITPLTNHHHHHHSTSSIQETFQLLSTPTSPNPTTLTTTIPLPLSPSTPIPILTTPTPTPFSIPASSVTLLIGGLGGLGRSITNHLISHGAKRIAFISRSPSSSTSPESLALFLTHLQTHAVSFRIYPCDASDPIALQTALSQCTRDLGPVTGVIHCAMVLRDTSFANMTFREWTEAIRPKVQASWNLHRCFGGDGVNLDFFIMLSSFVGTIGNPGQANYAAGCAFQDALADDRRKDGLQAVSIGLGVVRDVGYLAEKGTAKGGWLEEWMEPFGVAEGELHGLLKCVIGNHRGVPSQILTGIATGGSAIAAGVRTPFYLRDSPRFAVMARLGVEEEQLRKQEQVQGQTGGFKQNAICLSVQTLLAESSSLEDATKHVTNALVNHVAKFLHTSPGEIDPARFLHSYGIDSLSAIEIVEWARREVGVVVTTFDVLAGVSMVEVARKMVVGSGLLDRKRREEGL